MSEPQGQTTEARVGQLERQMLIDRNATNTLLNRTDQLRDDFRAMQATMANMQQDLHLIIDMFRSQQSQLDSIHQILNDRLPPKAE